MSYNHDYFDDQDYFESFLDDGSVMHHYCYDLFNEDAIIEYQNCKFEKKTCQMASCCRKATHAYIGKKNPLYCSHHKDDNMYNVSQSHCKFPGCHKSPSFNYESETTRKYCGEHKFPGMISISNREKAKRTSKQETCGKVTKNSKQSKMSC